MRRPSEPGELGRVLQRIGHRLRWAAALRGAGTGLAVALGVFGLGAALSWLAGVPWDAGRWALVLVPAGLLVGIVAGLAGGRGGDAPVELVERTLPSSRNLVRTAAELEAGRVQAAPGVTTVVRSEAGRVLAGFDVRRRIPFGRSALTLGVALAGWILALTLFPERPVPGSHLGLQPATAGGLVEVEVVVRPPAYTGAPPDTLRNPERILALQGSRLELGVRAPGRRIVAETVEGRTELVAEADGVFRGDLAADADGFVSLEGRGDDDAVTLRRMMGLTVRPDAPPRVEIVEPGRDLLLPDGSRSVELTVEASDEFGLDSLTVVFTKATGFGELFTFTEGEVPLEISRESATRWTAQASWPLDDLELDRGDIVVYFARAFDRRPDAPPGESETFMVEIMGSEAAVAGGFAGEDDLDRYALSQQMLIMLTERLMARRDSIPEAEFVSEVQTLAAIQRRIRAEFVFMLGGELEDDHHHDELDDEGLAQLHEEAHALADAEAAEGRLAQEGRRELTRAIQSMSHAAALLAGVEMEEALRAEETALVFLQRAFSSSRYILRAMTEREELDPARRLTGERASAVPDVRPRMEAFSEPGLQALRVVLAEASGLMGLTEPGPGLADQVGEWARVVLRVDPSAERFQLAAGHLADASDALEAERTVEAREHLARALEGLIGLVREGVAVAPAASPFRDHKRLEGAWADALSGRPQR